MDRLSWQGLGIAGFQTPSFLPSLGKGMMDTSHLLRPPLPSNTMKAKEMWLSFMSLSFEVIGNIASNFNNSNLVSMLNR